MLSLGQFSLPRIVSHVCIHTLAWYCYEWLVTLDLEINHIWARKWTLSTFTFVVSRYSTLFYVILQLLPEENIAVRKLLRTAS